MVTSPVMGNAGGIVPESKPIRKEASGTSRHGLKSGGYISLGGDYN